MGVIGTALWVIPLVTFLGYTSHQASMCTVRAVSSALTQRRFDHLLAFGSTVLWAMLLIIPITYLRPELLAASRGIGIWWLGLIGGFLFGLGAALNQGCSFSTLQRLADGDWRMLATLAGVFAGNLTGHRLARNLIGNEPSLNPVSPSAWFWALMTVLAAWSIWQGIRIWRKEDSWSGLLHHSPSNPAMAAMILGLGGGILYLGFGHWTYLSTLQQTAGSLISGTCRPSLLELILVPSIIGGMVFSAWRRKAWRQGKPLAHWPINLLGGLFMGLGSAIIPGGNDTLLLRLIPSLVPNSLTTYGALLLGIVVGLRVRRKSKSQVFQLQ